MLPCQPGEPPTHCLLASEFFGKHLGAPLQAVVCQSLCFIPSCRVSGAEKGGKAAGDGVDHAPPPTQALGMWPPWDPGRGLAWVPSAPGPLPSSGECVGGRCQRLACLWGGKDQLAGAGSALQLSQLLLRQVLMLADGDSTGFLYRQLPFLASLERKDGKATAYLCSNFTCSLPITSPQELRGMLCS